MSLELLLAGPTAVGKSAVAIEIAKRLNGEIISVDSMQVYRGLDIGTAKPGAEELKAVPHHLISILSLEETFDAAVFVRHATIAVESITARNRVPVLCGGTGLYFTAYTQGLGDSPAANLTLRAELETTPLSLLLRELQERDPVAFANIDRQNPRRVIRALEAIRLTGKPFSDRRSDWNKAEDSSGRHALVLVRSTDDLRGRIEARVEKMFEVGLVAETDRLLEAGLEKNRTAMQALGYRQVVAYLKGELTLPATVELVKARTRQFAKRQMTWFRKHMRAQWISLRADEKPEETADTILSRLPSFTA